MPTQTSFELIFLGNVADGDVVESGDGSVAENASDLLGTYGSAGALLSLQQFDAFTTDGNDNGLVSEDGEGGSGVDTLTVFDSGGNPFVFEIDSVIGFVGTVTYADGTTESGGLGVLQDNAGNLWLIPNSGGSIPNLNTKAIESIDFTMVAQNNGIGFAPSSSAGQGSVCFATGTLIDTPNGQRAAETLGRGDLVNTLDHGPQPLLNRCARQMESLNGARDSQKPIEIKPDSLGRNQPSRP